jgi:hypothetical protein
MFSDTLRLDIPDPRPSARCEQCEQPRPIAVDPLGLFATHYTSNPMRYKETRYRCDGSRKTPRQAAVDIAREIIGTAHVSGNEARRLMHLVSEYEIAESELTGIEIR